MKLYIKSVTNGIKIPPCPKKAYSNKYQSKHFYMNEPDRTSSRIQIEVLRSSASARAFIVDLLRGQSFPMAGDDSRIRWYLEDPEWYRADMNEFANIGEWLYDSDGQSLAFKSNGKWLCFYGSEDPYDSALSALKNSRNIECLIYNDSSGYVVYNCYVTWEVYKGDINDGSWWASESPDEHLTDGDPDDFDWHNVYGTMFQIPKWARNFKDIVE